MRLEYEDICIRNAEEKDCPQLAEWWNDGRIMAHAGFPDGLHTDVQTIRRQIENDSDETKRRLIIQDRNTSIGEMSFRVLNETTVKIGIKICNPYFQNRGLGRILLSMLLKELFARGYVKIVLDTDSENRRAQHVYELLGFEKTAVREHAWVDQRGQLRTAIDYQLDKDHFRNAIPEDTA